MLIVEMEMPKNCCECDLRQDNFDRGEQYCPFTGVECLSIGRQAKCPIKGELVTCGDCKMGIEENGEKYCCGEFHKLDWFCADGERKDGADDEKTD